MTEQPRALRRETEPLKRLAAVARIVTASLDTQRVFEAVLEGTLQLLHVTLARLWVVEPSTGDLVLAASPGAPDLNLEGTPTRFPKGRGLVGWVVEHARPRYSPVLAEDPLQLNKEWVRRNGLVSQLVVPLMRGDVAVGALVVITRERREFSPEEQELLEAFAAQAALAINNARLYEAERQARERLAISEARHRELVENVNDIVYVHDLQGRLLSINEAAVRISGYTREELLRMNVAQFLAPEDIQRVAELIGRVAAGERGPQSFTAEFIGKDGVRAMLECNPRTVFRDGVPVAIQGVARDVTIRCKLEERQAAFVEIVKELAAESDLDRLFPLIGERARQLLKADSAALALVEGEELVFLGNYGFDAPPSTTRQKISESRVGRVALTRRPHAVPDMLTDPHWRDSRVVTQLGYRAILEVPVVLRGEVIGVLGVLHKSPRAFSDEDVALLASLADHTAIAIDRTNLLRELRGALEKLEASQQQIVQTERLRALGEMAGGVAHDFNNMLAVILGRSQLLLNQIGDPELQRQLQVIEQTALDGARTVRRIQEFTRMRLARAFQSVDLNKIVEEVVELTRSRWEADAQAKGIRYDLTVEATSLPPVAGDPSELRDALANVLFNALDAMPEGGRVSFRTGIVWERVRVTVTDTGIGMTEEVRQRVFDPFFTTKGELGTGLGLSMVYGIIGRHGGDVEVQSQLGQGSQFTIWLPVAHEVPEPPPSAAPALPHRRAKILVIDDEPEVQEVLVDLLAGQGHAVIACTDGRSGLNRLKEGPFDLVITDLGMPKVSGWEVARRVKLQSPETPVALVTGWGDRIDPDEARGKGVDFIVHKPFNLEDVTAVVAQVFTPETPTSKH